MATSVKSKLDKDIPFAIVFIYQHFTNVQPGIMCFATIESWNSRLVNISKSDEIHLGLGVT